eukprot:2855752-Alexandrium_andersonii.AAC.1
MAGRVQGRGDGRSNAMRSRGPGMVARSHHHGLSTSSSRTQARGALRETPRYSQPHAVQEVPHGMRCVNYEATRSPGQQGACVDGHGWVAAGVL